LEQQLMPTNNYREASTHQLKSKTWVKVRISFL
jgi:hypothetical protein